MPYIPQWKSQHESECDRLDPDTPPEQHQSRCNQLYVEAAPDDNQRPKYCARTAGMVADRQGQARQTTRLERSGVGQHHSVVHDVPDIP